MTAPTQILAQSFANHRRFPPLLYMVAFVVLAAEIVVRVVEVVQAPSLVNVWAVVVIVAVTLVAYFARINAIMVQDRVIMLDMRLRLMRLLPSEQHTDIAQLTKGQLVALRFASDAELPALVQATIKESLSNTAIKQRISNWQADWQRV